MPALSRSIFYSLISLSWLLREAEAFAPHAMGTSSARNLVRRFNAVSHPSQGADHVKFSTAESSTSNVKSRASGTRTDYHKQWWPVAVEALSDASVPMQVTVMNEQLAVWWDPKLSRWNAVADTVSSGSTMTA